MAKGSLFNLTENVDREDDYAPHLSGTVVLDQTPFDAGAWIAKTKNGDPYVSLSLRPAADSNGLKIGVPIWQKRDRKKPDDPHFHAVHEILGTKYSVSATLVEDAHTKLYTLVLLFDALKADELSPRAKFRHDEISATFAALPDSHQAKGSTPPKPTAPSPIPAARTTTAKEKSLFGKLADPLQAEPDDIPF